MFKEIQQKIEEREMKPGDRVVIAAGLTGLGLCHSIVLAEMLEKRGLKVELWSGAMRGDDELSTHPNVFYNSLAGKREQLAGQDWLITVAIPLDSRDEEGCREKLVQSGVRKGVVSFEPKSNYETAWEGASGELLRLGRICARDRRILPVEERELKTARGIDAALMPLGGKSKEENRARVSRAVEAIKDRDWDYFREQERKAGERSGLKTVAVLGRLVMLDSSELASPEGGRGLGKEIERKITGRVYGLAFALNMELSDRSDMGDKGAITVLKRWDSEGGSLEEIMLELGLAEGFVGPADLKTWRGSEGGEIGKIILKLVEGLGGVDIPDFGDKRIVGIVGDPNSGKSVFSEELVKLLNSFGVEAVRVDADLASPTSGKYLREKGKLETEAWKLLQSGDIDYEEAVALDSAWRNNERNRVKEKKAWNQSLGDEGRELVEKAIRENPKAIVIVDLAGGIRNDGGEQVDGPWFRAMDLLEGVMVVSRESDSWERYLAEKGVPILGILESRIKEDEQKPDMDGQGGEKGLVAGLVRGKEAGYNPVLVVTALGFVESALGRRE